MDAAFHRSSIFFAIVTACVAGVLAALAWSALRDSPVGPALQLLAAVMATATVYHGGVLILGPETHLVHPLLAFGSVVILIALVLSVLELRRGPGLTTRFSYPDVVVAPAIGAIVYAGGGTLAELFAPRGVHWIHAGAALFVVAGLYRPVCAALRRPAWTEVLLEECSDLRRRPDWMMPIDETILQTLATSGLILTPAVIAFNADYSREEVNRRLTKLTAEGLVDRVERGKYRLTEEGERSVPGVLNGHLS